MASQILVHDTQHQSPALLIIERRNQRIQLNEFELTLGQALLFVGDLLDTIKAAALADAESTVYHPRVPPLDIHPATRG